MRLLFIEDDPQLGGALFQGLKEEYGCDWFKSAEEGASAMSIAEYDALILDINLPGMSGLQWLAQLREAKNTIPVLLLTARDTLEQRVEGLDDGADDYLVKPFDYLELLARLRALLRRKDHYQESTLSYQDIDMDMCAKTVTKSGQQINLSIKEFATLSALMENQGRCMSKELIEQKVYGFDDDFESNTIEVYISGIRKKLGKSLITTLRGIGYLINK